LTIRSTDCGSVIEPGEGDFDYTNLTVVHIEALADPGYYFVEWTGTAVDAGKIADPYSADTTVTMDADYTLGANFEPIEVTLIYVDDAAAGANVGSNWVNAINSLQDALLLAYFYDKPVEIRVAQGIYTPDKGIGIMPGDREVSFQLIDGVTIKGGYAGLGESDPDVRDVNRYETILSGDLNADDDPNLTNIWDNSFHVVTTSGTDATAVLDGFTITSRNDYRGSGSGIYIESGNPILSNCNIKGNIASCGAGVYNISGNPTFANCTFSDNTVHEYGAAMFNEGGGPRLLSCTFTENSAISGGSIFNDHGDLAITDCTFSENSAQNGGAVYNSVGTLMMADCVFIGNSAILIGGAVVNRGTSTILNCTFMENSASISGGGINESIISSRTNIINCLFCRNLALKGGAIGFTTYSTGRNNLSGCNIYLLNCTLTGNVADWAGGAIFAGYISRLDILAMNEQIESNGVIFDSCIIWDNTPDEIYNDSEDFTVKYCDVQDGFSGECNMDLEPLFADPENDDYHLKSQAGRFDPNSESWVIDDVTSPCIDAGDPNVSVGLEYFPNGGRINMGAYGGTSEASLSPERLLRRASNPNPADGTVGVSRNITLSWTPGFEGALHNVYFGIEFEHVDPSNDDSVLVSQHQTGTSYNPGLLEYGQTYYWRVDEVYDQGMIVTGEVWSFTTASDHPKGRSCFIGQTPVWIDGKLVPISKVAAAQFINGTGGINKIEELQEHDGTFVCYDVLLESGNCVTVAENHYFMAESGQWISLQNLKPGSRLKTAKDSIKIETITKQPKPYVGKVYNLKIENSDRYTVGADMVIVRDY